MPILKVSGKLVYIWHPYHIFGGNVDRIVATLKEANADGIAIKLHDGYYRYTDVAPTINAVRAAGMSVGGWGYIYLNNPSAEANAAVNSCKEHNVDYYLIDAESQAKYKNAGAKAFSSILRNGLPYTPLALNSFWKPSYHPELPWYEFRSVCDFDCPQVYWRGYDPVGKLTTSKYQYSQMSPHLPFSMVAGDMFLEAGIKPTPAQVLSFLNACKSDPDIQAVAMWSMDQIGVVPELWDVFKNFVWDSAPPPPQNDPLYKAVTTARLNVRKTPGGTYLYTLPLYAVVNVWALNGVWAAINQQKTEWCHTGWLDRLPDRPLYSARTIANLNVRKTPWGTILTTLPKGTLVSVWYLDGVWGAISPSIDRWVHTGYLARLT